MEYLSKTVFEQIRKWIYQNARDVELAWWKYHFENGSQEDVVKALAEYQNADGGFGHGLEPDCSNPESSPAVTYTMAYTRLKSIGCDKKDRPMIQGMIRYIEASDYFTDRGWYWSIPSNNLYPCRPWYLFPNAPWFPKDWPPENYVNGGLLAFILKYFSYEDEIYKKTLKVIDYRLSVMDSYAELCQFTGDWDEESIEAFDWVELLEALEEYGIKSLRECAEQKARFLKIVESSAIPEVCDEVKRRLEKREYTDVELANMIDELSQGRFWQDDSMADAMCWEMIRAIETLILLKQYGRIKA